MQYVPGPSLSQGARRLGAEKRGPFDHQSRLHRHSVCIFQAYKQHE